MEEKKFFSARGSPKIMVDVPNGDLLERMDNLLFPSMYCSFFKELQCLLEEVICYDHPTRKDLTRVKDALRYLPEKSPERFAANSIYFKISKLLNTQIAMLSEGYQAFEALAREIASSPKKYCMDLAADSGFKNMRRAAENHIRQHPKIVKLIDLVNLLMQRDQTGVIFVESEPTAVLVYEILKEMDKRSEMMLATGADHPDATGGAHHATVTEQLRLRSVRFVVAESRLQSLLLMNEVDRYIQFSVPQPYLSYATLSQRWDNDWNSKVYHLVLNHPIEIQAYWDAHYKGQFPAQHRNEKKLQRQTPNLLEISATPSKTSKSKKGKHGNNDQLNLFGN